jgi:NAD(P)H-hydrate epimerase
MTKLAHNLYSAEQVRAMDEYAIKELGVSGTVLMERAGSAAFDVLKQYWPDAKIISIICGTGNNAGDGYVIARLAVEAGLEVEVLQVGDGQNLKNDALAAAQRLQAVDIEATEFTVPKCQRGDVIVDALLGTGLSGEVKDEYYTVIKAINACGKPVLALDVPSGLDANTGQVEGIAVKADVTVTFIGNKQGLYVGDAWDYCGKQIFESLNVPAAVHEQATCSVEQINYEKLKSILKPRARNSHKGDFGHVLVVGGQAGYTGAARMAGEAAARCGAGLVSIATRKEHAALLNTSRPELMVHGIEEESLFHSLAERADVIAIGPGLGKTDWSKQLLGYALDSGLPLVMDADALNLLSGDPQTRENWVLTPHAGEAARLLGMSTQKINENRYATVRALQEEYGGIAVLKGPGSLVCSKDEPMFLCTEGNPGMASGGMGDILTGIIAALIAQQINLLDAASLGVCLHAAAGDGAARAAGERGMLATDLMSWVRRLANP